MRGIKKAILLPDIHYPHHSKSSLKAVNQFITDYQPDYLVYMGDQLNMDVVSSWNEGRPRLKENQRIIDEYAGFNDEILKIHSYDIPAIFSLKIDKLNEAYLNWMKEEIKF